MEVDNDRCPYCDPEVGFWYDRWCYTEAPHSQMNGFDIECISELLDDMETDEILRGWLSGVAEIN